jgi:hypothetical protein
LFNETITQNSGRIRNTVNNFENWPLSGAVMNYSGYVGSRDGAVSVILSSQQEAVACMRAVYSERKPLLCTAVVCEKRKSRMSQFEQQKIVNFCQKLGKSASETFQMNKQAYGEVALGRSAAFK